MARFFIFALMNINTNINETSRKSKIVFASLAIKDVLSALEVSPAVQKWIQTQSRKALSISAPQWSEWWNKGGMSFRNAAIIAAHLNISVDNFVHIENVTLLPNFDFV